MEDEEKKVEIRAEVGDGRISVKKGDCSEHYEFTLSFYGAELADENRMLVAGASGEIKSGKPFNGMARITDAQLYDILTDAFNSVTYMESSPLTQIHIGGKYSKIVMSVRKIAE